MARERTVFFYEEPVWDAGSAHIACRPTGDDIQVVTPMLSSSLDGPDGTATQRDLLDTLLAEKGIRRPLLWYYTPMSLEFSQHVDASFIIYDCMDQLSAFRGAPPLLVERERQLLQRADVVFTGGYSLYQAKRDLHPNVHAFPSSVDVAHFRQARAALPEPSDQAALPHPRIGHYAVLDERLDIGLVAAIADARPDWQLVLLGPVVKIDPADLPRRPNLHYLGQKSYNELPAYLSGWEATFMPFALNEATRFISPTKTPEYLAAGKRVVSTPIADVVRDYGSRGLVSIATTPDEFVAALQDCLSQHNHRAQWLAAVDRHLSSMSWDRTWAAMKELLA
jgi:UDP-galactopyranose mutase